MVDDAHVSRTAFVGLRQPREYGDKVYWLNDLVGPGSKFGFEEVEWDGVMYYVTEGDGQETPRVQTQGGTNLPRIPH